MILQMILGSSLQYNRAKGQPHHHMIWAGYKVGVMRYCILSKHAGPKSHWNDLLLATLLRNCMPCLTNQLMKGNWTCLTLLFHLRFHRVIPSICLSPQPRLQRGLVICGCSYGALRIPAVVVPSSQESWSGVRVLVLDSVLDVCSSDFYHVVLCHTACFRLTLGLLHCLSLVSNFVIIHFVFTRNFNKKTRTIQTAFNLEPDVPKDSLWLDLHKVCYTKTK